MSCFRRKWVRSIFLVYDYSTLTTALVTVVFHIKMVSYHLLTLLSSHTNITTTWSTSKYWLHLQPNSCSSDYSGILAVFPTTNKGNGNFYKHDISKLFVTLSTLSMLSYFRNVKRLKNIWGWDLTCLGLPNNKEKFCSYFCERGRRMEKTEEALLLFLALRQMGLVYSAVWKGQWKTT